jgi:Subtilase family
MVCKPRFTIDFATSFSWFPILGLLIALVAITPQFALGASSATIAPSLERVLANPDHSARNADGELAVWVYFVPRDLNASEREAALDRAETALSPDAARRRSKVIASGHRLVDAKDLPLDLGHLNDAAATGAVHRQSSRWLGAASYNATPAQVRALAALPCVRRVDVVWKSVERPEPAVGAALPELPAPTKASAWTLDYGSSLGTLELINVPPLHEKGFTGAGVTLAFLDTGFRMTHEALDHVPVLAAYDFAGDDTVVDTEPGDAPSAHAHGTQVTSSAVGYAPGHLIGPAYGASAILVRADDVSLSSSIEEDWWVAGLEWAEAQGADLVTSSLGFLFLEFNDQIDGNTAASTIAADLAAARGLLVINAIGNSNTEYVMVAPADGDSVVAVGATDVNGLIQSWSSTGPTYNGRIKPDVVAQGANVNVVDAYDDASYTQAGGTSLSAPFVAAVATLVLERVPFLTPMQVREALRSTADHSTAPNNQYGYGVIDALASVYYWGPRFEHEALQDSDDPIGPYVVSATVTDPFVLDTGSLVLHYRTDSGPWQELPLVAQGGDQYAADIPGMPLNSLVEYYLTATDNLNLDTSWPLDAPAHLFSFNVWQDTVAPALSHVPLNDQPLASWPPSVTATATDEFGVDNVSMTVAINGLAVEGTFSLIHDLGEVYARPFPVDAAGLTAGDLITYTLTATDVSPAANASQAGPYSFEIVAGAGNILVIDDGSGEASSVVSWISSAGYAVTLETGSGVRATDLVGMQAVVLLSGTNASAVASSTLRQIIKDWVGNGGRLIVEGGETGYMALFLDSAFLRDVLHASAWRSDTAGSLHAVAGQSGHALLTNPLAVSPPVVLNAALESDQDAMAPLADATLVLECADIGGAAGALVYDDQPADPAVQIVYLPFAFSVVANQNQARALVTNSLALLLDVRLPSPVDDDSGFDSPPRLARLVGVFPNPFNARAVVRIEMARDAAARMDIFDVRGHLVRGLVDGQTVLTAGVHDFLWDGLDDRGNDMGSGVYFARLTADGVEERVKLALVR